MVRQYRYIDFRDREQIAARYLNGDRVADIALLYTEADYSIYYGAITMIPEEGKGFVTVEGDKVPQTWIERRPDRRFLQINSKPLTVPHEVNSWYVAQVL